MVETIDQELATLMQRDQAMHGRTPERHFVRQTRSTIFWGILIPLTALLPGLADPGTEPQTLGRLSVLVPSNPSLLRGPTRLAICRMPGCMRAGLF